MEEEKRPDSPAEKEKIIDENKIYNTPSDLDCSISQVSLKRERKKGSSVWNHFEKDKSKKITCKYCHKNFSEKSSTGSLLKHDQIKHQKENELDSEFEKQKSREKQKIFQNSLALIKKKILLN